MQDVGPGHPALGKHVHTSPGHPTGLAPTLERLPPQLLDRRSKRPEGDHIRGHPVVRVVSARHALDVRALFGNGLMPASLELHFQLPQLGPHPLPHRPPHQDEPPRFRPPATMREAQEAERLRLPFSPPLSPLGRVASELNQARLVRMQLQRELAQALAQLLEEPLSVATVLESNDEVVGVSRDYNVATGSLFPPLLDPEVEDLVQVQVREQRRCRRSLRRSFPALHPSTFFHHPCAQPLLDESQHPWSPIRCSTNRTNHSWEMASKNPRMSASSTQFTFLRRIAAASASSASCWLRPGRNP